MRKLLLPGGGWNKQPQYPVNARKDLGLSFAANFIGNAARNVINNNLPPPGGAIVPSQSGLGVQLATSSSAGIVYDNTDVIPAASASFTIIAVGSWAAEARAARILFYGNESGAPYYQHALLINSDSATTAASGVLSAITYDSGFVTQAQSVAGVIDGKPHTVGWRNGTNASLSLWVDGKDVTSSKAGGAATLPSSYPLYINQTNVTANARGVISPTSGVWVFSRILSDAEMARYTANPWQIYQSQQRRIYVDVASGTITADASITQASNTSDSATALTLAADASITASSDTAASTSALSIAVDASITAAGDTSSSTSALSITADASMSQSGDTATADGAVVISADCSATQEGNTLTSAASLVADTITADASITQASNTAVADGSLLIASDLSLTQAGDTAASTSAILLSVDAGITQSGDTLSSTAALASDTITANADITQASNTTTADGVLDLVAGASLTQDGNTITFNSTLLLVALADITQAGNTLTAASSGNSWLGESFSFPSPITRTFDFASPI